VNWALIGINVVVFLLQQGASDDSDAMIVRNFALYPVSLIGDTAAGGALPAWTSLVTYMFLHAGWEHIFFNMLFLFTFGDNIEDSLGHGRYLVFYLLCGIGAGLAHAFMAQDSNVPLVGASGAIAGVVAAYMMLRPCAKIVALVFGIIPLRLGSVWVLGFWALIQVYHVLSDPTGDTAWWAHIGGLASGAILVTIMRPSGVVLFECMRPGDVLHAGVSPPPTGQADGPWGSR